MVNSSEKLFYYNSFTMVVKVYVIDFSETERFKTVTLTKH